MPDRPAADAPPTVIILPGATLLEFTTLADGAVLVECPACRAAQMFRRTGTVEQATFVHQDDDCPIRHRIETVLARLRAAQKGAGWN